METTHKPVVRKRLAISITIFILFLSQLSFSQTPSSHIMYGGYLILPVEFPFIDDSELNKKLENEELPHYDYPKVIPGYGFQAYLNGFVFRFSHQIRRRKKEDENFRTGSKYNSLGGSIGYTVFQNAKFSLYPSLGYKNVRLDYFQKTIFHQKKQQTPYAPDFFSDPKPKVNNNISYSRSYVDVGFGISNHWSYLIDIKIGYLIPVGGEEKVILLDSGKREKILPGAPGIDFKFYMTATVGLGKIVQREKK